VFCNFYHNESIDSSNNNILENCFLIAFDITLFFYDFDIFNALNFTVSREGPAGTSTLKLKLDGECI